MAFNFWDWEKQKELSAVLRGRYLEVGRFKRAVFCFEAHGKAIHSWSFVQLNNILKEVPFGTSLTIRYLGMKKMPDSARYFKDFSIEILDSPDYSEEKKKKRTK